LCVGQKYSSIKKISGITELNFILESAIPQQLFYKEKCP
jgi:hypothetical protein